MADFGSVLCAAQQLREDERLRLIDALWQSLLPESEAALTDEWARDIECRIAELDAGAAETVPWSQIRNEALGRISAPHDAFEGAATLLKALNEEKFGS